MRLADKVTIITGAGAGIGREAARCFAAEGANVVALDRDGELAEQVVDELGDEGPEGLAVACDVTDPAAVEAAVASAMTRFGRVDVVYNNAGGSSAADGAVHEVPIDEWWRTINVDLFGTFLVSRFGIRAILAGGRGGSVITTASAAALIGLDRGRSSYSAAKGGVISLTRAMAASYAAAGIRANAIAPGGTSTERIVEAFARRGRVIEEPSDDEVAIPALNRPVDVANTAVFLASDESRTITGQVLAVDGGSTTTRTMAASGRPS